MDIVSPKRAISDPDYNIELQAALDYPVFDLLHQLSAAGWSRREAFKALAEVIRNQALAYEQDADPEDAASTIEVSQNSADRLLRSFVDGRDIGP